jgi:hypothetical protein
MEKSKIQNQNPKLNPNKILLLNPHSNPIPNPNPKPKAVQGTYPCCLEQWDDLLDLCLSALLLQLGLEVCCRLGDGGRAFAAALADLALL